MERFTFLLICVLFHGVYIRTIFDVYFKSPIVHGMKPFAVSRTSGTEAPAQRLVLFVGDGLRADKAFQSFPDPSPIDVNAPEATEPRPLAPFLRSRVLEHGTFGVSHTRMPTESRPGHVALIAGLYEDVSAVTTGWKLNPVNFDSVFNRSRHTWSWGSPDILPMFKEGAVPGIIDADTYGHEFEDFTRDATALDTWVFEKVKELFNAASTNATLNAALRQDKNVFFLHLLGLDTAGHAYRPYSREYLHNIKIVDRGVKEITKLMEDFYADGKTAFVFTADHGMSDWGSHGDGHPDNTRTPLIAWGSGIAKPKNVAEGKAPGHEDGFSADWGLDTVQRHDVAQADIAALMAYLAGLEFPVNSVGELPLSYVSAGPKEQAEAALANARGVLEMYHVKEDQKKADVLRYQPFAQLGDERHSIEHRAKKIKDVIESGEHDTAIKMSQDLLHLGLGGLRYLQTYDWLFLRALVTLGYLGWIAFAAANIIDMHVLQGSTKPSRTILTSGACGAVAVGLFSFIFLRDSPVSYYAYAAFPLYFWEEVLARRRSLALGSHQLLQTSRSTNNFMGLFLKALGFMAVLEALVLSYFYRTVYTICFLVAAFWPFIYGHSFVTNNKILIGTWNVACQCMSVFTLLPALKNENTNLVLLGGFLMALVGILYLLFETSLLAAPARGGSSATTGDNFSRTILGTQIGLIVLAMIVTRSSIASIQAKKGLPTGNQLVGWFVLIASLTIPFLHSLRTNTHYLHRLLIIFLTFAPVFVILTISYEGLFYLTFALTIVTWVRLEHHIYTFTHHAPPSPPSPPPTSKPLSAALPAIRSELLTPASHYPTADGKTATYRPLTLADLRPTLFFLYLIQSAFFSASNIASLSSFSLDSVYRLLPIFDPFSQGALLMLKLLVPFAFISANLGILNRRLGNLAPSALFMCVMAVSDVLTLNFFWLVRDEGSWLDIGTSISHFVIASLLGIFVAGLEVLGEGLGRGVEVGEGAGERKMGDFIEVGEAGDGVERESKNGSGGAVAARKENGALDERNSRGEAAGKK